MKLICHAAGRSLDGLASLPSPKGELKLAADVEPTVEAESLLHRGVN